MTSQAPIAAAHSLAAQSEEIFLRLESEVAATHQLPPPPPFLSAVRRTLAIYYQGHYRFLGVELADLLNSVRSGQLIALHTYYDAAPEAVGLLNQIAAAIHAKTGAEILFPNSLADLPADAASEGAHIQLVASDLPPIDDPLPAAVRLHLRSYADHEALLAHGRRLLRIDLFHSVTGGLARMLRILGEMTPLAVDNASHPLWTWRSPNLPPDLK